MAYHHHRHNHLLLFLFFLITSQLISGQIKECPTSTCGDVEIKYPFWVSPVVRAGNSSSDYYCGYDDLKVTCKDNKTLTFVTSTDSYTVKEINYTDKTISLIDTDVLSGGCPQVRHELDISNISVLGYDPEVVVNLTFFFNCSVVANLPTGLPTQSTCLDDLIRKTFVFVGQVKQVDYEWLSAHCSGGDVVSPVLSAGVSNENVAELFPEKLRDGFQLEWKKSDKRNCKKCEESEGYCGYWNSTVGLEFTCFCGDGPRRRGNCGDNGGMSKKTKGIIIGVSAACFVCLVTAIVFCWRKKFKKGKNRLSSSRSSSFVRSISSDPSALRKETEYRSNHHLTHIFSYKELEDATEGFHSSKEVGDGGFGAVYKGELRDGRMIAVKRLYENNYKRMEQFMNEIVILNKLRHPNLVTLYGCTSRQCRELLLVYEYVANGTVADHLHGSRADERGLTWPIRMNIAVETAAALVYLHSTEPLIIHRDVKTHNILLDEGFHVKVGDFGLSRLFPLDATHVSTAPQGTPGYVDPEYYQCYQLTDKSDVYSFGVVLVELISSKPAVDISRTRNEINLSNMAINKIRDDLVHELVDPQLGFESDPDVTRMIRSVAELSFLCLQADKDMRPSMEQVKNELVKIASGGRGDEVCVDVDKQTKEDAYLLSPSVPLSPDTVTMAWNSRTTTPNTSA